MVSSGTSRAGTCATLALAFCVTTAARAADAPVAGRLDLGRVERTGGAAGADERYLAERPIEAVAFVDGGTFALGLPSANRVRVLTPRPPQEQPDIPIGGGTLEGETPGSRAGASLARVGDVVGDAAPDLLVGAPATTFAGRGATGAAYVVPGGVEPRRLGEGSVRIGGVAAGDLAGAAVSAVGDLDGDGRNELVIGAPGADGPGDRVNAGAVFVVHSRDLAGGVDLAATAHRIDGAAAGDLLGSAVSSTGDMSGDGRPELVAGAPGAGGGSGAAYVVFGRAPAATAPIDLATPGSALTLTGQPGERAGTAVAGLGAVAGRPQPHVAVGAPGARRAGTGAGAVFVVAGQAEPATLELGPGVPAGPGGASAFGATLAAAGDVDGDGSSDLLAGPGRRDALGRPRAGAAVLLLTGGLPRPVLGDTLLGMSGIRLAGPFPRARAGHALDGGVDANGDGRPDILVGHRDSTGRGGAVELVLTPPLPRAPAPRTPAAGQATSVEVLVDDSRGLATLDPGGTLRRQAIELLLGDSQDRVLGALEFGRGVDEIVPPQLVREAALAGDRQAVLRDVLAERIRDNGGAPALLAPAVAAAEETNPSAQAHVLIVGSRVADLPRAFAKRTFVLAIGAPSATTARLAALAQRSGGALHQVQDAAALVPAVATIGARLRGEAPLATDVVETAGVEAVPAGELGLGRPAAAADVTGARRTTQFVTDLPQAARTARVLISWARRDTRFAITGIAVEREGTRTLRVTGPQIQRSLATGRSVRGPGGTRVRARSGRTFVSVELRDLRTAGATGRVARAAARPARVVTRGRRTRGRRRARIVGTASRRR